jgi:FlaA1/EpsC-like NDP-sugar epimerase
MIFLLPAKALSQLLLSRPATRFCISYWLRSFSGPFWFLHKALFRHRNNRRDSADSHIQQFINHPVGQPINPQLRDLIRERTVLITGAAGSIGSELVRQVLEQNPAQIILVDQAESALYTLRETLRQECTGDFVTTNVLVQIANITDAGRMHRIFTLHRPDFVFHAAAYKHVPLMEAHPYEAISVNVLGTQIVADLAVRFSAQRFVLISTDKAVNPSSVMGATKRLAEMYVQGLNQHSATRFVVTRFGNVLDSSGSVVPLFRQQIARGGPVTITHPDITRYFMSIPEACQLVLEAVVLGSGGDVFVFDMGRPIRIADLARQLIREAGYRVGSDIRLTFTRLRPGEKLHEELLHASETALPTGHPRIYAARLQTPDSYQLQSAFRELRNLLLHADDLTLIGFLQQAVPEYNSQPSAPTQLDNKPSFINQVNHSNTVARKGESMLIHP